jgi:hypothetical protein
MSGEKEERDISGLCLAKMLPEGIDNVAAAGLVVEET